MSHIEYDHGLRAYLIVVFYVAEQRREILLLKLLYFWVIGLPLKCSLCCIMQDSRFNYSIIQSIQSILCFCFFHIFPHIYSNDSPSIHRWDDPLSFSYTPLKAPYRIGIDLLPCLCMPPFRLVVDKEA